MTAVIQLKGETRERLKKMGKKGETYDDIINRLMGLWETAPQTTRDSA